MKSARWYANARLAAEQRPTVALELLWSIPSPSAWINLRPTVHLAIGTTQQARRVGAGINLRERRVRVDDKARPEEL